MQSYRIVGCSDDEMEKAICSEYKDENHQTWARQVAKIGGDFTQAMPVGWNPSTTKKRDYKRTCRRYISARAKEEIKPVGFIEGIIFWAIISGIISWITQKLMHKYFDEQQTSMED